MSADQFEYTPAGQRPDAYATQPLPVGEIADRAVGPAKRVRVRPRQPGGPGRGGTALQVLLSLALVALLGVGGSLLVLDRSYQGKIYPNVSIQGIAVGDLTPEQAEAALRARYEAFLLQPATVSYAGREWRPTLDELGVSFDFRGAIDAAYRAGRGGGMIDNARQVAAIWQNGLELPLHVAYDERRAQAYLAELAAQIERAPVDAQVRLVGSDVEIAPAAAGRQVLVDATLQELSAGLVRLTPVQVELQTRVLEPQLDDATVAAAREQIEGILQAPVEARLGSQQFAWPREDLAKLVQIARVPGESVDSVTVTIDRDRIAAWLKTIADETERPGTKPRVAWNNGQLKITRPGDPGLRVDEARALDMFVAALAGRNRAFELPTRLVDPPVTEANLHTLGIRELVSVGKSDFTGSAGYRIHNIGVGMGLLNGILIAPGEEFSFNTTIGDINAANGFVEGAAIVQNRTQQEFGGGICQDSTTIFRAAFWAGLPITERWGHSFYISWYDKYALGPRGNGPGLDATIFTGGPDLKFLNDTGNWLLIQAWSNPKTGVAQVELYGTATNRVVDLTHKVYDYVPPPPEPRYAADPEVPQGTIKQTDRARGGMTIDVYRLVTINGVAQPPELFRTRFRPWPNIYTLNPVDIGPDGKPLIQPQSPEQAQPTPAPEQAQPTPAPEPPPAEQQPPVEQPPVEPTSDG